MKILKGIACYFLLVAVTVITYLGTYVLAGLIFLSRSFMEENFKFLPFIMETIVGIRNDPAPDIYGIEIAAIMGSGYLVGRLYENYLDRENAGKYALLGIVVTVFVYYMTVLVVMIMGETNYHIVEYLLVGFAPVLFILPFGAKY